MSQAASPRADACCQPTWAVEVGCPRKVGRRGRSQLEDCCVLFFKPFFFFGHSYRVSGCCKSHTERSLILAETLVGNALARAQYPEASRDEPESRQWSWWGGDPEMGLIVVWGSPTRKDVHPNIKKEQIVMLSTYVPNYLLSSVHKWNFPLMRITCLR